MGTLVHLKSRLLFGVVIVVFPLIFLSVRMTFAQSDAQPEGQDALHEVLPGDNLHLIAGYYYGDCRQWERIWKANRKPVRNPNLLTEGMILRIPDVTTPEEQYTDFVARVRRSPTSAAAYHLPPGRP